MAVNIRGRNYLKLLDYTPEEIRYLLDLSKQFKNMKRNGVPHKYLDNRNIVLLFEKTSTRTRCAFEVAGRDLGMGVTYLDPGSRRLWRSLRSMRACLYGTGLRTSSIPPRCWPTF